MTNWISKNPFQANPRGKWEQQPPRGPRLMERDGYLFVVQEYALDEPGTIEQLWFPIGIRAHDFSRSYYEQGVPPEGLPARSLGVGEYEVDLGGFRPLRFRLSEGGATKAKHIDWRKVTAPKVRKTVDLRWSGGSGLWMKSSKSTKWEWVPA